MSGVVTPTSHLAMAREACLLPLAESENALTQSRDNKHTGLRTF